ncbi:surfeit locus protein 1 isoform X1 [Amborella trichopoda]|uniref:SURF1-like protein n=1 Tax=Amborella trichopoda TaxID=13333 RepID=W1P728_AMBTC|nr:surfeit locus protein 1 isoform X1 [Amborella trichopoda]XP_020520925.1 surfeit locus protein 1 isoform X1 [Amborella trichopoda]ERN02780.1 hypothetical protein AMTR_s00086p00076960 [Amborella trichopoda]|eukprot:XP_006841105.1 surfeit locus protein 1 isoform X1 [Amborella trichopoda]
MASAIYRLLKPRSPRFSLYPKPSLTSAFISTSQLSLSSSSTQTQEGINGESERKRWSSLFLFLPGAITFGLGTWQLFRRQEKIEMLEYRRGRLALEPLTWTSISSQFNGSRSDGEMDSLEFRRVLCEGVFDESKSVYIGPRSRSISGVTENGYYVVTPLMPVKNKSDSVQLPILVNRGWVPRSWRNKFVEAAEEAKQPSHTTLSGIEESKGSFWSKFWPKKSEVVEVQEPKVDAVKVIGVVRGSEKPSIFVPENDPGSGQWFYVDVPAIARACGIPENTVYVEDINENVNPSYPYPVPKGVNSLIHHSVMPQDHLNYTLTWYSLSAAVTFMAAKGILPKKNRR